MHNACNSSSKLFMYCNVTTSIDSDRDGNSSGPCSVSWITVTDRFDTSIAALSSILASHIFVEPAIRELSHPETCRNLGPCDEVAD
jgi:hypothetical protein